jgi:hypothetical protein
MLGHTQMFWEIMVPFDRDSGSLRNPYQFLWNHNPGQDRRHLTGIPNNTRIKM